VDASTAAKAEQMGALVDTDELDELGYTIVRGLLSRALHCPPPAPVARRPPTRSLAISHT
jgi:hypothetical protein